MSNKLHSNIYSEDEIVGRVWKVISWAFDQGRIVAGRYVIIFIYVYSYFFESKVS